ncbi:MAG: hypothetical protein EAZ91_03620 [Cytophagales bacterium]|nr:MAG: hypothetical protein EAZ91_03620 [Cytophagales bacterium]
MAYSDFTLEKLKRDCGVGHTLKHFMPIPRTVLIPSPELEQALSTSVELPLLTEKSKSEFLISPILHELYRLNDKRFTIYSGFSFDVSEQLYGYCDYLLGSEPTSLTVDAPIFCVVEAKNRGIEEGLGQCGAEMYGAWLFNRESGSPINAVYGSVTNGFDWVFLRYQGELLEIDLTRFTLNDLPELLGALQTVIDSTI